MMTMINNASRLNLIAPKDGLQSHLKKWMIQSVGDSGIGNPETINQQCLIECEIPIRETEVNLGALIKIQTNFRRSNEGD